MNDEVPHVLKTTLGLFYDYWSWGEALAFDGLWEAAHALQETSTISAVVDSMVGWAAKIRLPLKSEDHVIAGSVLLKIFEETRTPECLRIAQGLVKLLNQSGVDRITGCLLHRRDQSTLENLAWVDAMYYDGPFLARLGRVLNDGRYFNWAGSALMGYAAALWKSDKRLFAHYYDAERVCNNSIHWGRGNGWALLGLVDTASILPKAHWARMYADGIVRQLVSRLIELQDVSGLWHTVVDDPTSYLEGSLAAMFVAGVGKAYRNGIVEKDTMEAWERACAAVLPLAKNGNCQRMSSITPWSDNIEHYRNIPLSVNPWGQGAWLRAVAEVCKVENLTVNCQRRD